MDSAIDVIDVPVRNESKRVTRDRLLRAARTIFLKTGYKGAKLDDIAAAAGFTKGALYWHFPNKQSLFLALIADSIAANLGTLDDFLAMRDDPAALKQRIGEWIDGIDARETLPAFGVELEIESRYDPRFRAVHQRMIAGHEQALANFLAQYFDAVGERPTLPVGELAQALVTIFKGYALTRQNRGDPAPSSAACVRLLLGLPPAS